MAWARLRARRQIEAEKALVGGIWRERISLNILAGGVLASLTPLQEGACHAGGRWVVPPAVRLAEERDEFACRDGKATVPSIRRHFGRLLEAGFGDIGVVFALNAGDIDLGALMQEALLFAHQANELGMGFSFLGRFDLIDAAPEPAQNRGGKKARSFCAKSFEDQILAFEMVAGALCAAKLESPLGWSQWVRLDPRDARSRASLTALRVRFAHLPTILEVAPPSYGHGAEALYELLRLGVLDAQVTLNMPWHPLTSHQATALAARGVQWTVSPDFSETALAQLKLVSQQTSLGLVFQREKHPLLARSDNSSERLGVRSAQTGAEHDLALLSDASFDRDVSHRALGLPERRLAVGEPLAALSFHEGPPVFEEKSKKSEGSCCFTGTAFFDSPHALFRHLS